MLTDLHNLNIVWQVLIAAALVVAGLFALLGSIGMLRFPDFFMRLHAPTKATTLGVGGALIASMLVAWSRGQWGVQELLITLLLFLTAPVSASLMAKAALHLQVPCRADELSKGKQSAAAVSAVSAGSAGSAGSTTAAKHADADALAVRGQSVVNPAQKP